MTDNVYYIGPRADGSKPVTVEPRKPESQPVPGTVKVLEKMLAMAKTGRLQSFIATGWTDDNDRLTVINLMHDNVHEMLGALTWLQHEYVQMVTDRNDN